MQHNLCYKQKILPQVLLHSKAGFGDSFRVGWTEVCAEQWKF